MRHTHIHSKQPVPLKECGMKEQDERTMSENEPNRFRAKRQPTETIDLSRKKKRATSVLRNNLNASCIPVNQTSHKKKTPRKTKKKMEENYNNCRIKWSKYFYSVHMKDWLSDFYTSFDLCVIRSIHCECFARVPKTLHSIVLTKRRPIGIIDGEMTGPENDLIRNFFD